MSVTIDLSRDERFDELGLIRLRESYMRPEEKSPQERLAFVAETFASNPEHAHLRLRKPPVAEFLDAYSVVRPQQEGPARFLLLKLHGRQRRGACGHALRGQLAFDARGRRRHSRRHPQRRR